MVHPAGFESFDFAQDRLYCLLVRSQALPARPTRMVTSARFELAASWFEARRSIQMSYEAIRRVGRVSKCLSAEALCEGGSYGCINTYYTEN